MNYKELDNLIKGAIIDKKRFYIRNRHLIKSDILRDEIFETRGIVKDEEKLEKLAKISIFLDIKIDEKAFFTNEQKEYMVESLYSQYIFLKEEKGISFEDYLEKENKNLKKIEISDSVKKENNAVYNYLKKTIVFSKEFLENIDDGSFYRTFSHENNHCFSTEKAGHFFLGKTGILTMWQTKVSSLYLGLGIINELTTEASQLEMSNRFFPEFVEKKDDVISFKISTKKEMTQVDFNIKKEGDSYPSILCSKALFNVYREELLEAYLNDNGDTNLKSSLKTYEMDSLKRIADLYRKELNSDENSFLYHIKMEGEIVHLIGKKLREDNLDETYIAQIRKEIEESTKNFTLNGKSYEFHKTLTKIFDNEIEDNYGKGAITHISSKSLSKKKKEEKKLENKMSLEEKIENIEEKLTNLTKDFEL